jgi:hypothetical protein
LKGGEKARYEEQTVFVKNLILNTDFSIEKIALLSGTSVDFVTEIIKKLENKEPR